MVTACLLHPQPWARRDVRQMELLTSPVLLWEQWSCWRASSRSAVIEWESHLQKRPASCQGYQEKLGNINSKHKKAPKQQGTAAGDIHITENTEWWSWWTIFLIFLMFCASNTVHGKYSTKQEQREFWVWFIWVILHFLNFYFWAMFLPGGLDTEPGISRLWKTQSETSRLWNTLRTAAQLLLAKERDLLETTSTKTSTDPDALCTGFAMLWPKLVNP